MKLKIKFTKIRIFIMLVAVFGLFMAHSWLLDNPEYTTYNPDFVVERINGELFYIIYDCPPGILPEFKANLQNCALSYGPPPPAYYIHQNMLKYQTTFDVIVFAILGVYLLIYRKQVKEDWKMLKEFFKKMEMHDDKKQNNR